MCLLIAYYRELGEKMRLLVTGGAGFIGSNFVRRTLATRSDVQITVLDALTYAGRLSNLSDLEGKYEFVQGNICDASRVDSLVSQSDVVIHFAAESHNDNSLKSPRPFIDTNVIGTFELIQACVKHDVRFHHVSTDEVFGDLALEGTDNLKATISNCSNNFGPYQHEEKLIPRMIGLIASGVKPELYGNGANVRDWIHVDDHNDGVWAVIEKGVIGQTYLLGADNQRSNLEVVRALLGIMGKPEDFIAFIGDRPGHDLRYAIDASATEAELGWKPKHGNFEEKLAETVSFYDAR
jgi:dTDP-glucose 4,6-dehydratase